MVVNNSKCLMYHSCSVWDHSCYVDCSSITVTRSALTRNVRINGDVKVMIQSNWVFVNDYLYLNTNTKKYLTGDIGERSIGCTLDEIGEEIHHDKTAVLFLQQNTNCHRSTMWSNLQSQVFYFFATFVWKWQRSSPPLRGEKIKYI